MLIARSKSLLEGWPAGSGMGRQRALHTETHPCAPLEGIYLRLCVKERRQSGITGNHLSQTDVKYLFAN